MLSGKRCLARIGAGGMSGAALRDGGKTLMAVAAAALVGGCAATGRYDPPPGADVTRIRWTQAYQVVRIARTDILAVHLPCALAQGRDWRLSRAPSRDVLMYAGKRYTGDQSVPCARRHEVIFYFEARAPGLTSFVIESAGSTAQAPRRFEAAVEVYY